MPTLVLLSLPPHELFDQVRHHEHGEQGVVPTELDRSEMEQGCRQRRAAAMPVPVHMPPVFLFVLSPPPLGPLPLKSFFEPHPVRAVVGAIP